MTFMYYLKISKAALIVIKKTPCAFIASFAKMYVIFCQKAFSEGCDVWLFLTLVCFNDRPEDSSESANSKHGSPHDTHPGQLSLTTPRRYKPPTNRIDYRSFIT